jgi:hypothetical protein
LAFEICYNFFTSSTIRLLHPSVYHRSRPRLGEAKSQDFHTLLVWSTSTVDKRTVEACRSQREDSQLPQSGITLSSHAKDSPVSGLLARNALELSLSTIREEAASLEDDLLLYLLDMTIRHMKKKSVNSSSQFVTQQEQNPFKLYHNRRRRSNLRVRQI